MLVFSPFLRTQRFLMLIATVQGLLMLGLYRAFEHKMWPASDVFWSVPAWTLVLILPVLLLLTISNERLVKGAAYCLLLAGILTLSGFYIGSQLSPEGHSSEGSVLVAFALCMIVAVFKGLMYVQQRASGEPRSYPLLFSISWRNFLVMALALLFVGIVGLLLLLWSALFDAIGVGFFEYLFSRDWFLFPLLGFAFGVGVALFREMSHIIDSITRLLQGMIRFLLPLLVVMTVGFLLTLVFVGLPALWGTGFGTGLVLWLTALLLFFVNAVYQDGRGDPAYSQGVHRLIYGGLLALPVLSLISGYGLWLRIDQYGLSVERIFAGFIWLVLGLFALGYAFSILRRRDDWTLGLASVNTNMGLVVLTMVVLLNSPVIDPRAMTVSSQLSRLDEGLATIDEVDLQYFRMNLAKPGAQAVASLKAEYGESHPHLAWAGAGMGQIMTEAARAENFWSQVVLQPADLDVPESLMVAFNQSHHWFGMSRAMITTFDLSGDGNAEYVLFNTTSGLPLQGWFFLETPSGWKIGVLSPRSFQTVDAQFVDALEAGRVSLEPRLLSDIRVGNTVFQPNMQVGGNIATFRSPRPMQPHRADFITVNGVNGVSGAVENPPSIIIDE